MVPYYNKFSNVSTSAETFYNTTAETNVSIYSDEYCYYTKYSDNDYQTQQIEKRADRENLKQSLQIPSFKIIKNLNKNLKQNILPMNKQVRFVIRNAL